MAVQENRSNSGNGFLYFVVGALVVGLAVLAWMVLGGQTPQDDPMNRVADSVSEAAESISDSAREAAENVPAPQPAPQQQ